MKPQVMMMRLKVLDAKEKLIENIGPFPAVEIDNLILVRRIPLLSLEKLLSRGGRHLSSCHQRRSLCRSPRNGR
jgi:hypothetical protein